jgi:hypothetical protein
MRSMCCQSMAVLPLLVLLLFSTVNAAAPLDVDGARVVREVSA